MCWTTSFLWYGNLYHGRRSARGEFPSVPGLGTGLRRRTDGTDGAQVAQLRVDHAVHLLGQVALPRRRAAFEDEVDGLRTTDDHGARRVRGRSVRRDPLALEEVDLRLEDPAD